MTAKVEQIQNRLLAHRHASCQILRNPSLEKPKTNFIKPRITEFEKAKKLAAEIVPPEPKKVSRFKAESTKNRSVSGLQTEAARVTDILKSRVMDAARGVVIEKGESGLDGPQSTSTERNGERKKSSPITEVERIELLQQQLESTKKVSRFKVESAKNRALETALTEVNPRIADTTKPRVMDAARGAVVEKDERQPTSTEQVVLKKKGSFLTDAEVCKQVTEYESGFDDFVEAKKKMSPFKSAETSKRVTDKEPPVAEQAGPTKKVSKFKAAEAAKRGFDMRAPSDNIVEAQKKMSGVQAGDSLKKHGEGLAGSRVTNPVKPQITETIEPESIESTTGESAQPAKKVSLFKASRRHT
ncbi:hypothetical protein BC829DRAFT_211040 [Chytridium lagenaria]|nr:hypothetical protein BC829DRAFT_211040 [Chytridium lagenaria]